MLVAVAAFMLGACLVLTRNAVADDWENIGYDVMTKCNHGNRIYIKIGSMSVVTMTAVQGCESHE